MKLEELGLKTKPASKYFEFGYVRFYTIDKELYYEVNSVTKTNKGSIDGGKVMNKEHLQQLMSIKTMKGYLEV